ncbi:pyridoxamine 5'-phosphate oxidase family protein [Rhizobium sp. Root1220]|uniref:pyridoxamine 5'-phosphate oxidase family protein n=1 Tax=Rhizobium sp. Root1220 TaxID=1736432 RepID=UPI0006F6379C|nr:pyridoxamine 5'-phosphate oxidase family protein [Rhizobium sp. Root1220]KQV79258.1 flavin-nucleotide-binding protein [Rhizobium sp. Root1220]
MAVREMTERESRELLAQGNVGHLACVHDNHPYVVPVHYAFDAEKLYVFSLTGQKIDWLRSNPNACLQVEASGEHHRWKSVVAEGTYHELPDTPQWHNERLYAWSLLQKRSFWWEPGSSKPGAGSDEPEVPIFFSISIDKLSGRELVAA